MAVEKDYFHDLVTGHIDSDEYKWLVGQDKFKIGVRVRIKKGHRFDWVKDEMEGTLKIYRKGVNNDSGVFWDKPNQRGHDLNGTEPRGTKNGWFVPNKLLEIIE